MPRVLYGTVTSDKASKSIVITVRARRTHPLYKKQYTVNTKFMAHDEKNQAKVGDKVTIVETRPQSARKRFKLDRIIERGGVRFEESVAMADIPNEVAEPKPEKLAEPAKKAEEKPEKRPAKDKPEAKEAK